MTEENKTAAAPEAQAADTNGKMPDGAVAVAFPVALPAKTYTARQMIERGAELAAEWNAYAEQEKNLLGRLGLVRVAYARIHEEMTALYNTCKTRELPLSDEMVQMVEQRTPHGATVPPNPVSNIPGAKELPEGK